jgi:nucleolar pre-ribosomal-associated protein 1
MSALSIVDNKRVVCLIEHRLSHSDNRDYLTHGLLTLLASILERLPSTMSPGDILALTDFIFVRPGIIKTSLMSETLSNLVRDCRFLTFRSPTFANRSSGYHQLVKIVLNPQSEDDRMLISEISGRWLETIRTSLGSDNNQVRFSSYVVHHPLPHMRWFQVPSASIWIKYLESSDLFGLLDTLGSGIEMTGPSTLVLLEAVLDALHSAIMPDSDSQVALIARLPQLLALRPFLRDSDTLEDVIAAAVEMSLPAYCNGQSPNQDKFLEPAIVLFIKQSEVRWSRRLEPLSTDLPVQPFLTQQRWSTSTTKIISGLLYRRALSPDVFFVAQHGPLRWP